MRPPQALSLEQAYQRMLQHCRARGGDARSSALVLRLRSRDHCHGNARPRRFSAAAAVDATGNSALAINRTDTVLNTRSVSVTGKASISSGPRSMPSTALKTGQASVADPYAGVTMPALPGACSNGISTQYAHSNTGVQTISPGVWCDGVSFTNDANVLLRTRRLLRQRRKLQRRRRRCHERHRRHYHPDQQHQR